MNLRKLVPLVALLTVAGAAGAAPASFLVKVSGHGKPMILIPGLSCGGEVWNTTVAHYQEKFECHVLTLPGFAGQPSIKAPMLTTVRDEIIAYITEHHLDHPVIVGHSLGGTLALWIAAKAPSLVGKVVSVDGVPWLPAILEPTANMELITQQSMSIRSALAAMNQQQFAEGNKRSLQSMVTSPNDLEFLMKTGSLSDPKAVGEAMFEMYTTDLRPQMSKITAPVLLLGEQAGVPEVERKLLPQMYEDQIHLIPNHKFAMAATSKHFIMLDDPKFFFDQVDKFLG